MSSSELHSLLMALELLSVGGNVWVVYGTNLFRFSLRFIMLGLGKFVESLEVMAVFWSTLE